MPLDPSTTAALTNTIDNTSNIISAANTNKKQREWADKNYEKQRAHALMDWEMQNKYNSPQEQMARLKAAGLNPNLVYGNGAEAMSSSPPRSSEPGSYRPETPHINTSAGLMAGYQMQQSQAQTDQIQQMTEVAKTEQALKLVQAYATLEGTKKTQADTASTQFDLQQKNRLSDLVVSQAEATLSKTKADTTSTLDSNERAQAMQAPTIIKAIEDILTSRSNRATNVVTRNKMRQEIINLKKDERLKELDINLKKNGIQPGDPAWMRAIIQAISSGRLQGIFEPYQSEDVKNMTDSMHKKFGIGKYKK